MALLASPGIHNLLSDFYRSLDVILRSLLKAAKEPQGAICRARSDLSLLYLWLAHRYSSPLPPAVRSNLEIWHYVPSGWSEGAGGRPAQRSRFHCRFLSSAWHAEHDSKL